MGKTMKKLLLLTALVLVAGAAPAQKKASKAAPKMTCAVTKEKLDVAKATKDKMFADYKGRRYFFCCQGCPQTFKKNPEKYAKTATSIPTPSK